MMFRFMGFLGWAAISIAALSCNPAKRALDQKRIIDEAIAKWVLENPIPMSEIMLPGDTLVIRDTAWVDNYVYDTVYRKDTVRITKTAYKVVKEVKTIRDTVVRTVNNTEAIIRLSDEKNLLQGRLYGAEKAQEKQRWWIVILAIISSILLVITIRRR